MTFLYLKAVHIIFIVTWFAGLFYMTRLLIYITEAHAKPEPAKSILLQQLKLMATRLWYVITWPSAVITFLLGTSLLINQPAWLSQSFMHVKLALVFLLYLYHFSHHVLYKQLMRDEVRYSSQQLRVWNEVGTLFLFAIVFLIVLKSTLNMAWGVLALVALSMVLMIAIRLYKKFRKE